MTRTQLEHFVLAVVLSTCSLLAWGASEADPSQEGGSSTSPVVEPTEAEVRQVTAFVRALWRISEADLLPQPAEMEKLLGFQIFHWRDKRDEESERSRVRQTEVQSFAGLFAFVDFAWEYKPTGPPKKTGDALRLYRLKEKSYASGPCVKESDFEQVFGPRVNEPSKIALQLAWPAPYPAHSPHYGKTPVMPRMNRWEIGPTLFKGATGPYELRVNFNGLGCASEINFQRRFPASSSKDR